MKDFRVLKLLDLLHGFFQRLGVDYGVMRIILRLKLTMDQRRVPAVLNNNSRESSNSFMTSLVIYAFLGIFIAVLVFMPFPLFLKMNLVFGMIIFMVMLTMVSDFSAVLLDVKEKTILVPRPVSQRTINAAKLVHIIIYLSGITIAIAGPSLAAVLFRYGPVFFAVFFVELLLICGFTIFFTAILYYFILSFFDGEKLKDVINYFQIVLTVFMTVGYQFAGRIFDFTQTGVTFTPKWWSYLLPSTWFAAPFSLINGEGSSSSYIVLSILAVVIPICTFTLYIKTVIPYFEKSLNKLNSTSPERRKGLGLGGRIQKRVSALLCFDRTERAFFRFTQNVLSKERKLKLRLFPNLALAVIFPFIFMLNSFSGGKSAKQVLADISGSKSYLMMYLSVVFLSTTVLLISSSEKYKGAWLYRVLPVKSPVPILKGALKGFIVKYIIPAYIFESVAFTLIYGLKILPHILLMFLNMILLILLLFSLSRKELPFSREFQYTRDSSIIGLTLLLFLVGGLCAGLHYLAGLFRFGVIIGIIASACLITLLWRLSFRKSWSDVIMN